MKKILVKLSKHTAAQLKAVAPRAKDRAEFVRQAIAHALLELAEVRTREAYRRWPAD